MGGLVAFLLTFGIGSAWGATLVVPSPEWHRENVRKRLAEHRANPDASIPWEQVRAELLARFGRRR